MGNKNTIEFNGKIYDALTGKLIKSGSVGRNDTTQATDGFIKPKPEPKKSTPKPVVPIKPKRPAAKQHQGHKPARSMALMRSSVKKPAPSTKPTGKSNAASSLPAKHLRTSPIAARLNLSERRLIRAQQTTKGSGISHFKNVDKDRSFSRLKPLPVKNPEPTTLKPAAKIDQLTAVNKLDSILATGLAKATSHEQLAPFAKKVKKDSKQLKKQARKARWLIISVLITAILLLVGLLLVRLTPSLEFDIATSRSGVHINLPSYEPAGFRFSGPGQYASGILALNFSNKSTGQKFNIVAQNSDWDSQTLLYSFVIDADPKYQPLQKADLTLYVYNQTNVTWVNGGVWYRLSSSGLSADQLANIAASL